MTSDSPASSTRTLEHDYVQVPAPAFDQRFPKLHEYLRRLDTEVYQPALHFYQENYATHPTFSIFAAICAGLSAFPVALFILLSLFQILLIPFLSVTTTLALLVTVELVLVLKLTLSLIACAGVSVVATFTVVSVSPFFRDFKFFDPATLTSITHTVAENAPAWRDAAAAFFAQIIAAMRQLHASAYAAVLSRLQESTARQKYIDTSLSFVQAAYRTGGVLAQVSITVAEGLVLATKGLVIFCSSLIPIMSWIVTSFGSLSESRTETNATEVETIVRDPTPEARASSSSVRSTSEVRQRFAARTSGEISSPNPIS